MKFERHVRYCKGICEACKKHVEVPNMGDMNYGYLVFTGLYGEVHVVAQVVAVPIVDELLKLAKSVIPPTDRRNLLQHVLAACADPIAGRALTIGPICPHCLQPSVYRSDDLLDYREIDMATFEGFARLSPKERMTRIRRICIDR